jgi:ATP-binding cassette, subfamily B, bacterial MsbA
MRDFRILLRNVKPYAGLFALAFSLMTVVGIFDAGRTALLKSIIDSLDPAQNQFQRLEGNQPSLTGEKQKSQIDRTVQELAPDAFNQQAKLSDYLDARRYFPQTSNPLPYIAGLLILFTLIRGSSEYFSNVLMWRIGVNVVVDMRQRLYEHILKQSSEFFTEHPTNTLTTHIISDAEKVQTSVSTLLADLIREGMTLLFYLLLVFVLNWRLTLVVFIVGPLIGFLTNKFGKRLRGIAHTTQESTEEIMDIAQETISGYRIVNAFGMEAFEKGRFRKALLHYARTQFRAARVVFLSSPILEILGVLIAAAFLIYAQQLMAAGLMTIGTFAAYIVAMLQMYDPLRKLSRIQNYFQQSFAAFSRIYSLLDTHTEKRDKENAVELPLLRESIEFRGVGFQYQDSRLAVLEDINIEVKRGQVVALVGLSGAGKSTLTNLLMRFYDPTAGEIRIDGLRLTDAKLSSLRGQLSLVTQETILFNDSIVNNIAYGRPDFERARIEAAARAAYAHDFILERGGYDTVIGERGVKLSGGERQRLAIG